MKRLLLLSAKLVCTILISSAQAPEKFNYQAVARDNTGTEIKNQSISVRMSIRSGSTTGVNEYVETFSATTNEFGLFAVEVGGGSPVLGSMSNIDWGNTSHFLAVEVDFIGGTNFQLMSITQLLSVPYALYAEKSGGSNDGDTSSTNEIQVLSKAGNTVYLSKSGGSFIDEVNYDDSDSLNELQNLSIAGHDLTISMGNTITFPDNVADADADSTNELQNLSISGKDITISKGNTITIPDSVIDSDADSTNELQNLTLSNDTIFLSNGGGFVKLPLRHYIGEYYGGGIVFHVDRTGEHGLIVSLNEIGNAAWSNVTNTLIGANAQSLWNGNSNSNAIINQSNHTSSAANLCINYNGGSNLDWYLPSIDEYLLIHNSRYELNKTISLISGASTFDFIKSYWSSTERSANEAYKYGGNDGYGSTFKTNSHIIRAVRAF